MELPVATHSEMSSKRKIHQIRKGPKYFKLNVVNKRSLYTNILIAVSSKALHFKNISIGAILDTPQFEKSCKVIAGNKALKYPILHFPPKKICRFHLSGQNIVFHQPRFSWNKESSFTKPPFWGPGL